MINVALIGCGRIADLHVPVYKNNKDARIYAVCEPVAETLEKRKIEWKDFGIEKFYSRFEDVIADKNIDAVEILTPQKWHESMAIAALNAGKHVALQKPMTISMKSADKILAAARNSDKVFKITEGYIYYPPIVEAKKMLDEGKIGELISVNMKMIAGSTGGWDVPFSYFQWRIEEHQQGRGMAVFDHGHHLWATAWYIGGPIDSVSSKILFSSGTGDTPAAVIWKYKNCEALGMAKFATSVEMPVRSKYFSNDEWMEFIGSKGIICLHRNTGQLLSGPVMTWYDGITWHDRNDIADDYVEGFNGANRNFINAILKKEEPKLSGEEAREILRLTFAILKANTERREVYVDEIGHAWPAWYRFRRRRQEKREARKSGAQTRKFLWFDPAKKLGKFAGEAKQLTLDLPNRFSKKAPVELGVTISLTLLANGSVIKDEFYLLSVRNNEATVEICQTKPKAVLMVAMPAGAWAAVLLKKKRIEMAFLQGLIKAEGDYKEAVKLREHFDF